MKPIITAWNVENVDLHSYAFSQLICTIRKVFCKILLSILDLIKSVKPDEKSVITYVSAYYHALHGKQQVYCHYYFTLSGLNTTIIDGIRN